MFTIQNDHVHAKKLIEYLSREGLTPIFDVDGVLADASHRISLNDDGSLDLDHYRSNTTPEQVALDKELPLMGVVNYFNAVGKGYSVATARVVCGCTWAWFKAKAINPFCVWARDGENDRRKDCDLKGEHFIADIPEYLRGNYCLIDDNLANCERAKELGMKAVRVCYEHKG